VKDLLPILLTLGPLGLAIGVVAFVFLNPDKAARWGEILWALIARVWKAKDRRAVQLGLQSRMNSFSRRISSQTGRDDFTPVQVGWTEPNESVRHFYADDRLVIRLHRHERQDRNLVTASMLFVSQTLVRRAKTFLSKKQAQSIDLFGVDWLLADTPSAKVLFREEVLAPEVDRSPDVGLLILRYRSIDAAGAFFPVFVRELNYLGQRVVVRPRNEHLVVDVQRLTEFLERYSNRVLGERVPLEVQGTSLRCAIVIVAQYQKREAGLLGNYVHRLRTLALAGNETLYLVGPASAENTRFMTDIASRFVADGGWVRVGRQRYRARLRTTGNTETLQDTLLIILRSGRVTDVVGEVHEVPPPDDLPLHVAPDDVDPESESPSQSRAVLGSLGRQRVARS
jgi:hypothetical protein